MWYLYFKAAAYKFATVPEASACFGSKQVNGTGNKANDPPGKIVYFFITHSQGLNSGNTIHLQLITVLMNHVEKSVIVLL
jgi:hypothetical protein